jgi:hypothetical protein
MKQKNERDQKAWEQAKQEVVAAYPYDTNFGRDLPMWIIKKISERATEITKVK